jgi:hypothetical protein
MHTAPRACDRPSKYCAYPRAADAVTFATVNTTGPVSRATRPGRPPAQHCLQAANGRLWSGGHPDALGLVYDGAARSGGQGASQVAESVVDAVRAGASG